MPLYVELDGQRIDAIYHSSYGNVPEGALPLQDDDFVAIHNAGGQFGLFDYVNGRAVLTDRQLPPKRDPQTEINDLKAAVQELAAALPTQSPQLAAVVARLSAK